MQMTRYIVCKADKFGGSRDRLPPRMVFVWKSLVTQVTTGATDFSLFVLVYFFQKKTYVPVKLIYIEHILRHFEGLTFTQ